MYYVLCTQVGNLFAICGTIPQRSVCFDFSTLGLAKVPTPRSYIRHDIMHDWRKPSMSLENQPDLATVTVDYVEFA